MKVFGCGVMWKDADKGKESIYIETCPRGHFIHKKSNLDYSGTVILLRVT
jgi:hypothetical protein